MYICVYVYVSRSIEGGGSDRLETLPTHLDRLETLPTHLTWTAERRGNREGLRVEACVGQLDRKIQISRQHHWGLQIHKLPFKKQKKKRKRKKKKQRKNLTPAPLARMHELSYRKRKRKKTSRQHRLHIHELPM